ncbi:hypothetical protein CONPUDRAFT_147957 [Coniophora puteana RWD-64-598 SS2]|uniref:F-box domain-containing protein n=1 Tax=Coniophora puteana (strain RWD-64-598) TaxID=741705 RepID=R7SDN2_CONPW|nr:uncharacterized protein CONPUDRAFT_147957 [Coniophora puteana RWD-64-598 SS2]EIW73985.1 hypothetical protein CONPUDRAFT_147957 [Coniophora puteana RWD-64-598 SS2]
MTTVGIVNHQERQRHYSQIDNEIATHVEATRALYTRRNMLSPTCSIPAEVLCEIFAFAAPLTPGTPLIDPRHLLLLTQVCKHWREVALNFPHLWSIYDTGMMPKQFIMTMLERAKEHPLDIYAKVTNENQDLMGEFLSRLHQTRLLFMDFPTSYATTLAERLTSHSPTILQTLHLVGARPVVVHLSQSLVGNTPKLNKMVLRRCALPWRLPIYGRLTRLDLLDLDNLSPSPKDLWTVLEGATSLEVLKLSFSLRRRLYSVPPTWDLPKLVDLPRIKYISINENFCSYAHFFSRVRVPPDAHISVTTTLSARDAALLEGNLPPMSPDFFSLHRAEGPMMPCNTLKIGIYNGHIRCSVYDRHLENKRTCKHHDDRLEDCRIFLAYVFDYHIDDLEIISPFSSFCHGSPLISIHTLEIMVDQDYLGEVPWCVIFPALPRIQRLRASFNNIRSLHMIEALAPRSRVLHAPQLREISLELDDHTQDTTRLGECMADALEQRASLDVKLDKLTGNGFSMPEPYLSRVRCVVEDVQGFEEIIRFRWTLLVDKPTILARPKRTAKRYRGTLPIEHVEDLPSYEEGEVEGGVEVDMRDENIARLPPDEDTQDNEDGMDGAVARNWGKSCPGLREIGLTMGVLWGEKGHGSG